jgi:hypothetical protein
MAENHVSEHDAQQIAELHRKLLEQPRLEAAKAFDICEYWRIAKPYWPIIVKAAKLIPKIGNLISDILEKLGKGFDLFCGSSSS